MNMFKVHQSFIIKSIKRRLSNSSLRKDVTEIQIPVPWGHVTGKWWGDRSIQPVLALHGWQDNAGTFDPLLQTCWSPSSVLAIDFPGHGLSSHFPQAMLYHIENHVTLLLRIKQHFGWKEKLAILGHSYGGIIAFVFASLFPELVGTLASMDVLKPIPSTKECLAKLCSRMDKRIVNSVRDPKGNPGYSLEELEHRWVAGTLGSLTLQSVSVLLKRGAKLDPVSGLYSLTRDPKVKIKSLMQFNQNQCLELAGNIKCRYLVIRFSKSNYFEDFPPFLETVGRAAESFEVVMVEGTHHEHLNNPNKVAPLLNKFFQQN